MPGTTFTLCELSPVPIWIALSDGIEVNLPGDANAPFNWAVDYMEHLMPKVRNFVLNSIKLLEIHATPSKTWTPDCIVVLGSVEGSDPSFRIEFSNESDPYGLWWVAFKTMDGHEVGTIGREQS